MSALQQHALRQRYSRPF